MGGGGGGGARDIGDLRKLEEKVREALSRPRRNVFIAFAYEDIDEVNLLRGQSKNDMSEIAFNDWSVPEAFDSTNADYIRRQITERIRGSSLTVVYLSADTPASRWVNWEVEKSLALGKHVLAVHAGPRPPSRLPDVIKDNGVRVVPWSGLDEAIKAIPPSDLGGRS